MKTINYILFSVLLKLKCVLAESCAPVGNLAQSLPVYDQGQTSMCYAYTATQMWDSWRKRAGVKVPPLTSPSELAFRYTSRDASLRNWKDVQGGNTVTAASILFNEGGCPYYNIEDLRRDVFGERWSEFEKLSKLRKEYFIQEEKIEQRKKRSGLFSKKSPHEKKEELVHKFTCDMIEEKKFPEEAKFLSEFIKKALDTGTIMKYFRTYFEKGCVKHGRLSSSAKIQSWSISNINSEPDNLRNLKSRLDKALESGKAAPGISYCSGILSNPGTTGIKSTRQGMDCSLGDSHASIVVDRRPGKNGACDYLVRNTWGTSCNAYAWPCQMGQVWVPETELLRNTMSVLWIQ